MKVAFTLALALASSGLAPVAAQEPANVLTPEQFGAAGDGKSDDTQALQHALDAAKGRKVALGEGKIYAANRKLTLPDNTFLEGRGKTSVLRFAWSSNPKGRGQDAYLANADHDLGNHDITLANFTVSGAGSGLPAGLTAQNPQGLVAGIKLTKVERFSITNLEVRNVTGISILYLGCSHGLIADNSVHHSGRDGITGMWSGRNVTDIQVRANKIERVGDDGIAVWGDTPNIVNRSEVPKNIVIADNEILGWPRNPNGLQLGRGIAIGSSSDVAVENNRIDRTTGAGILIVGSVNRESSDPATGRRWLSTRVRLSRNSVNHAGADFDGSTIAGQRRHPHDGIDVDGAEEVTVTGNSVADSYGKDVVVKNCRNCMADGGR